MLEVRIEWCRGWGQLNMVAAHGPALSKLLFIHRAKNLILTRSWSDFPYSYSLVHPQMNPILLIMIRFSIFDSILLGWKKKKKTPGASYNRNYRVLCLRNYIVCWDLGFDAWCVVHSSLFSLPNQWSNGAPLFGWKAPDWKILRQVSGLQINGKPIMSHK